MNATEIITVEDQFWLKTLKSFDEIIDGQTDDYIMRQTRGQTWERLKIPSWDMETNSIKIRVLPWKSTFEDTIPSSGRSTVNDITSLLGNDPIHARDLCQNCFNSYTNCPGHSSITEASKMEDVD